MAESEMQPAKGTVLVVDDEDTVRDIIARKLQSEGYDCVVATSGKQAVETAARQHFDLVLTDVKMPGMSGIEVLSQIATEHPDTGVVMITAVSDTQTAVEAMRLGAYDYVTKPFDLQALSMRVEKALEKRRLLQENKDYKLLLAEQALQESQQQYSALVENLADAVLVFQAAITWCNDKVEEVFGYTQDELMGKDASFLFSGSTNLSKFIEAVHDATREQKHFRGTNRVEKKDGSIVDIEFSISRIQEKDPPEFVAVARDITERRRMEEALRESEEKFRDLFENANDLIQSVDGNGRFAYVNRKWLETLGYTHEEVKELTLTDILREDQIPHCMENFKRVSQGESVSEMQSVFVSKNGLEIHVEGNVSPRMKDGELVETRGIFRDITERKEIERMKTEFTSNVSHELRTPLQSIMGFTKLILRGKVPVPEPHGEFLSIIDKQSEHLSTLINSLLDVSRIESGQFSIQKKPMSLKDMVHDVAQELSSLAQEKGIVIVEAISKTLPQVEADEKRLKQVMVNLLSNAVKFSNDGGEITVKAKVNDHALLVQVTDRGIGIPAEAIPHLFERFYQVDGSATRISAGTGLGLYICGQIVEAHGGRIWAESKPGEGSTFSFTVPLAINPAESNLQ